MIKNTAFAALYALVNEKANAIRIDQKSLAQEEAQILADLGAEE